MEERAISEGEKRNRVIAMSTGHLPGQSEDGQSRASCRESLVSSSLVEWCAGHRRASPIVKMADLRFSIESEPRKTRVDFDAGDDANDGGNKDDSR